VAEVVLGGLAVGAPGPTGRERLCHVPQSLLGPGGDGHCCILVIMGSISGAGRRHRKLAAWLDTLQTNTQPARRPTNRRTPNNPSNWTPKRHSTEP
jgi:hypothetical protein